MSVNLFLLRFLAVVGSVLAAAHCYVWHRLVKSTGLGGWARKGGTWLITGLFLFLPLSGLLARLVSFRSSHALSWLAYFWLGTLMLLVFALLFADCLKLLLRLCLCLAGKGRGWPAPARLFRLDRALTWTAVAVALCAAVFAVRQGAMPPAVRQFRVRINGLPPLFKGFRIVQISDVHVGEMQRAEDVEEIVRLANGLRPDLVAITGDLVDGDARQLLGELAPLAGLRAAHGVFFVTGNHEYYSGVEEWLPEIERLGARVLGNDRREIRRGEESLFVAGINDRHAARFGRQHEPNLDQALQGIGKGKKIILLAHQPMAVRQAAERGVDFVLAGHMHGGQIWPFKHLAVLQQPYLTGFHREQKTLLYVSEGTGCWGPPMRLGTRNEIVEFILE